jgi:hypothetical protein
MDLAAQDIRKNKEYFKKITKKVKTMEKKENQKKDNVNHPSHYADCKYECIDVMEDWMTNEEFEGYLKGCIFKYLKRYNLKNGLEDCQKAQWYLNKLVEFKKNI